LAEFINTHPGRTNFKVMFTRESEGLYRFGTMKKVGIKLDKKQLRANVGKEYLSIEKFLDKYGETEFWNLKNKDPNMTGRISAEVELEGYLEMILSFSIRYLELVGKNGLLNARKILDKGLIIIKRREGKSNEKENEKDSGRSIVAETRGVHFR